MTQTQTQTQPKTDEVNPATHTPVANFPLRFGMYRGSTGGSGMTHAELLARMAEHPTSYFRLYIMIPPARIETLEHLKAATFDLSRLRDNRLFLTTKRIHGDMYWQLLFLYPGVPNFKAAAAPYTKGLRPGQIHRDSDSKQFRTSFGLNANPFVVRAYQDFSGYEPFSHRAVDVDFNFYKVPEVGIVAIATNPIKMYIRAALQIRVTHPHLKIHNYPMKKCDLPFETGSPLPEVLRSQVEAKTPSRPVSIPVPKPEPVQESVKPPEPEPEPEREPQPPPAAAEEAQSPTPQAPAPVYRDPETLAPALETTPSLPALMQEGTMICNELNQWLRKMQFYTSWTPQITTQASKGYPEVVLSLQHRQD